MKISRVKLHQFRRFSDLEIKDIPNTARLVVLAGPNGSGKSSLFDAFNLHYQLRGSFGWQNDPQYYVKGEGAGGPIDQLAQVTCHDGEDIQRGGFYFRSAYRNDPEFQLGRLERVESPLNEVRLRRMIEQDSTVSLNYRRLASQALQDVFANEDENTTIGAFREKVVGEIRDAMQRLFPDLRLNSLGNPLENGTFRFKKGVADSFHYKNLSGGEKAAFDLVLDIVSKRNDFPRAIYCIDEPEAHMNSRLQGALLEELCNLVPRDGQLWVATHSIGMMRKARELHSRDSSAVVFLNFDGQDFDQRSVVTPVEPNRAFWESVLHVALDDLASLVAPSKVVICEGNPAGAVPGKNVEHDAHCYNGIFGGKFPDVKFISAGNSHDVAADRLGFLAALPKVAKGITVERLIDRDDHSAADSATFLAKGIKTLSRRHIESYLYDDEILTALCVAQGKSSEAPNLIAEKVAAIAASVRRGNPLDDVKSAAGDIYVKAKQRLGLVCVGNDQSAFARNTLVPLIVPQTAVYKALRLDIFGI